MWVVAVLGGKTRPTIVIMRVGALRVRLLLRQAQSLKDKRQVVRSISDRIRNAFNVSVAEVDYRDDPKVIVLGFSTVAEETVVVQRTFEQITNALRSHPEAEFVAADNEVFAPDLT